MEIKAKKNSFIALLLEKVDANETVFDVRVQKRLAKENRNSRIKRRN